MPPPRARACGVSCYMGMAWQAVERVTEYLAALPPEDVASVAAPTIAACDALLKLAHSADNPQGTVRTQGFQPRTCAVL